MSDTIVLADAENTNGCSRNEYLFHKLDGGVGEEIRSCVAELLKSHEARIWVAENTMTVSIIRGISVRGWGGRHFQARRKEYPPRNDLSTLKGPPKELLDVLVGNFATDLLLHVELPSENLLVSETVRVR